MVNVIDAVKTDLNARSVSLVRKLDINMPTIVALWVAVASFICGLRLAFPVTPVAEGVPMLRASLPYALVVTGPVMALLLALRAFPKGALYAQPEIRLARYGRWAKLDCVKARSLPCFGATGLMASLLIGILLNIPVRTMEYLAALPAIGGQAPGWLQMLFFAMTADVVLMSSLYAVAFVMALRLVPFFPRFLLMVWGFDLVAQIGIAQVVTSTPDLPASVGSALHDLLDGNLHKAMISIALWLPYLLLSDRVNLTYRSRVRI